MADAPGEGKLNIFNLGEKGVINAKDPLHVVDGELMQSQNAVANHPDSGIGGLEKRGGMTKLHTAALAGAVKGLINIPLPDRSGAVAGARAWYWNQPEAAPVANPTNWRTSADGVSWGAAGDIVTPPGASQIGLAVPYTSGAYRDLYCATLGGKLYYPGYHWPWYPAAGAQAPVIRTYDGVVDAELCRIPYNFKVATTAEALAIIAIHALDNRLFVSVLDAWTALPNARARVFELNGSTGQLTQIGNAFGPDAGEAAGGAPHHLAWFGGRLWAGTIGGDDAGLNQTGQLYWIRPGVDTTWTLDHTTAVGQGHITGLEQYRGDLYVGTSGATGLAALILKRTPSGVWSTSKTGSKVTAGANSTFWSGLRVFNDELYAVYNGTDVIAILNEVHRFDGTAWALDTDLDPAAIFARYPGMTVVRGDALYVAITSVNGRLARKSGGAWTIVANYVGTWSSGPYLGFVE